MSEDAGEVGGQPDAAVELAHLLSTDLDTLRRVLPDPISRVELPDDAYDGSGTEWFYAGSPVLVMIGINEYEVRVGDPAVRWDSHTPVLYPRKTYEFLRPEDLPRTSLLEGAVEWQIRRTRRLRMRRFRRCEECGQMTPPEWRYDASICQSCAERNHGVIH